MRQLITGDLFKSGRHERGPNDTSIVRRLPDRIPAAFVGFLIMYFSELSRTSYRRKQNKPIVLGGDHAVSHTERIWPPRR